jgi:hypothetical protein
MLDRRSALTLLVGGAALACPLGNARPIQPLNRRFVLGAG